MKKGITLVSLVITIIVLLILAGITLTLTIGNRGIIARAKQAGENYLDAQNYEQEMLNNLDKEFANQLNGIGGDYSSSEQASEFRKLIAQKITSEGVETSEADIDQVIVDNIGKILEAKTSDADAIADNISEGKIAYVNGQKIIGTGADNNSFYEQGAASSNVSGTWRLGLTLQIGYNSSGYARTTFSPICDVTLKDGELFISYVNENYQTVNIIGKTISVDPVNDMTITKIK